MEIRVRAATPDDAARMPAVERSASGLFRDAPGLAWIADDSVLSPEQHLQFIASGTSWLAEAEPGQCLGFLCAQAFDDELHIWELAVRADHQRQGIGKQLVRQAYAYAAKHGLAGLTLTTFHDVPWNAPWYAKLGFQAILTLPGSRLESVLALEGRIGLPVERRTAMRLAVRPA